MISVATVASPGPRCSDARDRGQAIAGRAEALPLDDDAVDAAMACATIHHWEPPAAGLAELRRVARGRVVVFTFDLDGHPEWIKDYLEAGVRIERPRLPAIEAVAEALGGRTFVERVRTPADCADGFVEAFWNRPEAFLDPGVRAAQSTWSLLGPGVERRIVDRLRADLESGAWDAAHGHLRRADSLDGSLRLVISDAD